MGPRCFLTIDTKHPAFNFMWRSLVKLVLATPGATHSKVLHLTHRQLSPLRPCTYIEMAAIDWLPVVRAGMVSMWIELSFMIFFALGVSAHAR